MGIANGGELAGIMRKIGAAGVTRNHDQRNYACICPGKAVRGTAKCLFSRNLARASPRTLTQGGFLLWAKLPESVYHSNLIRGFELRHSSFDVVVPTRFARRFRRDQWSRLYRL